MEELTLTTPALLFSAVSLILLAYTNRFLSYAQLVRTLKEQHLQHPSKVTRAQIDNLRRRLHLTRTMQILGVTSLFLCVVTMFLLYVGLILLSAYVFGAALLLLIGSLGVSIWEIQISVRRWRSTCTTWRSNSPVLSGRAPASLSTGRCRAMTAAVPLPMP